MQDVDDLIELILSDEKLHKNKSLSSKLYTEEPIIRTASQLPNYMPEEYKALKKTAVGYDEYFMSNTELFYKQGKCMEWFEDNFDYRGNFVRYYPTYQSMDDLQLRGYFSWRTRVRNGCIEQTSLSFVYVYIYELLNQIGVKSAQEGFDTLKNFWLTYREFDRSLDFHMKHWLNDYVVYYSLDKSLLDDFSDASFDKNLLTLMNYADCETDELFSALCALSSYNPEKSRFYKDYMEDVKAVVCAVFADMSEYSIKNRKNNLCQKLFGHVYWVPYRIFDCAVFYDRMKYENYSYIANDLTQYVCSDGFWRCQRLFGERTKSIKLGAMIKAVDCVMREKYAYKHLLKPVKSTKLLLNTIDKEIDKYLEEKKKHVVPKIEIDVSKLGGIRRASIVTQKKLIVDETEEKIELDDEPILSEQTQQPVFASESTALNQTALNDTEYKLMQCLLYRRDYASLVNEKGLLLSVVVDSINEKLYDLLGDTAVDFDADKPHIIEDYEVELKGIIADENT